jgi:hypothetical protein
VSIPYIEMNRKEARRNVHCPMYNSNRYGVNKSHGMLAIRKIVNLEDSLKVR